MEMTMENCPVNRRLRDREEDIRMVIILHVGQLPSGERVTQAGWCDIRRRSVLHWPLAGFEKAWEEGQGNLKHEE